MAVAQARTNSLEFAGSVGPGMRGADVFDHEFTLAASSQAAIHAVSVAVAAVPGCALNVICCGWVSEMDRPRRHVPGYDRGHRFCLDALLAAMVGYRGRSTRDARERGLRRRIRRNRRICAQRGRPVISR